jgi:hypothetical protein
MAQDRIVRRPFTHPRRVSSLIRDLLDRRRPSPAGSSPATQFVMMAAMREKRAALHLKAPAPPAGSTGPALRLPGRPVLPGVDDHLVEPEVTRDEIVGGRRLTAFPAQPPHATQHSELDYLVRAHVAPGHSVAADLLTRHDPDSDFATDVCVFKRGIDPSTGDRHLEEIAFEVVSEQGRGIVTAKARKMHRRGVRRIFTVWVKDQQVREWSPATGWRLLKAGSQIEDPCLVAPLAVTALLDAAAADDAVAEALVAKGNPVLRSREAAARAWGEARGEARGRAEGEARGEARGRAEGEARGEAKGRAAGEAEGRAAGVAEAILKVLAARGVAVGGEQREAIVRCRDLEQLERWLLRAALASSTDEVLSRP